MSMIPAPIVDSHHTHIPGQPRRHWLHPNGRHVHIARSPEELEQLRKKLSAESGPDVDFDVHLHGSPEHLEALRETHGHHERRRDELRKKDGDAYDEFENVRTELDALAAELHNITDHGVALDANFSKYGYSARLRTKGDATPPAAGPAQSAHSSERDWDAERQRGTVVNFYQTPVVRQYFHKGLLWRASSSEEVASFELFVDLLYVGIIAVIGDTASEHPTGGTLLDFVIAFILSWKIWSDLTLITSWFETNDIFQRFCVLFVMACLFGLTTNIVDAPKHTYAQMIAFYLAARLFEAVYFVWISFIIPMMRAAILGNALAIVVPSALWIASIHVEEPQRQALIWIAIVLDLFGQSTLIIFVRGSKIFSKKLGKRMEELFDFYPAVNIEHKTERTNAFVTLVFGYSVVALLYQNRASLGLNAFFGKAILGLVQAFAFNWLYFEIDSFNLFQHAIRRSFISSMLWLIIHLPFIMSYILSASALSRLVVAHDCADAAEEDLTELYQVKSEDHLSDGLRWFYCAGLSIALASMGIISLTHLHKKIPHARLSKTLRLAIRFAVALTLLFLPLAHSLNSLQLISTTTGMVLFVLFTDLYGVSCVGEGFVGHRVKGSSRDGLGSDGLGSDEEKAQAQAQRDTKADDETAPKKKKSRGTPRCVYEAECPARLLKSHREAGAGKEGAQVKVEEMAREIGGEKGVYGV
ncbi:MAG: hypothetical protein M1817_004459 [Caeruleum heppii]|nr:MAG: hypothetical protein M1817_004459 [Caeruleum heppii]